ncbi:Cof-type HAD-IIB family hydrolase [Flavobacteriaceae bacterium F89]|uniref:Cof-type HAD-IIB family hydrolase n=1 Tax=Cerina litoralis TaxID=2874477 RepID=A0AAE3EUS7_9FLAO|nr:Cof-type HAD-IIB family hydrolase [Cerina litoralis]MCG2460509.1 Cof-type HAD-IIB family hydrolase [Cerina litoralis]
MKNLIPLKKSNFKILCSDIDGTLLSNQNDVSNFTVSEIARIKNVLRIILVSARMPQSMTYLQERLGLGEEPIICYNGALIMEGENEIFSRTMPLELVEGIYREAKKYNIKLGLYFKTEWYVETDSARVQKETRDTRATPVFRATATTLSDWKVRNVSAHKIMLMGTKESTDQIFPLLVKKFGEQLHLYRSNDTLIEVAPKSVSKLSAIKLLLQPGQSLMEVIAFGDNYNDLEMIQSVGCGVAVKNARAEVKVVADEVSLKNTEDGVAHWIQQNLIF